MDTAHIPHIEIVNRPEFPPQRRVVDPVGIGLVTSLARPGGNVTGMAGAFGSMVPKRVELLREVLPGVKRLGLLVDPTNPSTKLDQEALAPLVAPLGLVGDNCLGAVTTTILAGRIAASELLLVLTCCLT